MRKFNTYCKYHKQLRILLVAFAVLLVIELVSGGIILASHYILGSPKRISHFRFHPFWTGEDIGSYGRLWNEPHPVYGYQIRLNVSDECGLTTDRQGYIHNGDSNRNITKEAFTIFIVGGSTVVGHGSSCNDQTISAHLERILSEKYPGVMVINAGVAGYYSPIEFLKITNEILFYDPEIVISLSGTNDFRHDPVALPGREPQYFLLPYHINLMETLEGTNRLWWSTGNFLRNIVQPINRLYVTFLVKNAVQAIMGKRVGSKSSSELLENVKSGFGLNSVTDDDVSQIREDGFKEKMDGNIIPYTSYIKYIESIVHTAGSKYYFLLQPILFTESRQLSKQEKLALEIAKVGLYKRYEIDVFQRARYFWNEVDKRLNDALENYYDFRDVFEYGDEAYSDHIHYSDAGNRVIAERISNILIKNGALTEIDSASNAD